MPWQPSHLFGCHYFIPPKAVFYGWGDYILYSCGTLGLVWLDFWWWCSTKGRQQAELCDCANPARMVTLLQLHVNLYGGSLEIILTQIGLHRKVQFPPAASLQAYWQLNALSACFRRPVFLHYLVTSSLDTQHAHGAST